MSDEDERAGPGEMAHDDEPLSVGEIAYLDDALERLVDDRRPSSRALTEREVREHQIAAQLRLARTGVEEPTPAFLAALEHEVGRAVSAETLPRRRPGVSRGQFLRVAATLAGGAGLGVAGVEGVAVAQENGRPHDLIVAGNERWYDIAAVAEMSVGRIKSFSAGGVQGFVLNTGGRLHAVSAICTHMGCRVKPDAPIGPTGESAGLHCLCHGSRFDRSGAVTGGLAPSPLPPIALRIEHGRIYALGTKEDI